MPVKVIDRQTQQEVDVSPAEAQKGFLQGRFVVPEGSVKVTKGFETGTVDASQLQGSLANGWQLADEAQVAERQRSADAASGGGQTVGALEAAASGATFGLSTYALERSGLVEAEDMAARRKALGSFGTAAEIGGGLAATLLTGGLGAAGGAARGGSLAKSLLPAAGVERLGLATERALAGALGSGRTARVLAPTARGFVEGVAGGAGATIDESVLGKREITAEALVGGGLAGGLLGGAMGSAMPIAGMAVGGAVRAPANALRKVWGRGTGAPGGMGSPEIGKFIADKIDLERLGNVDAEGLGRRYGRFVGGDEQVFGRLGGLLKTKEGRARLLANLDDERAVTARHLKDGIDEANTALDEAVKRVQGRGKLQRLDELLGSQKLPVRPTKFEERGGALSVIDQLERENIVGPVATEASTMGMRPLDVFRKGYDGATPSEVRAIAAGEIPSKTGRKCGPVDVVVNGDEALSEGFDKFVIRDGRHRIAAAKEAGANRVLARVHMPDGESHMAMVRIGDAADEALEQIDEHVSFSFLREQRETLQQQLADTAVLSPDLKLDLGKALRLIDKAEEQAKREGSVAGAFRAVDDYKRELDFMAEGRNVQNTKIGTPESLEAAKSLRMYANDARAHLGSKDLYGEAAEMHSAMNKAASAEMSAMEDLRTKSPQLAKLMKRGVEADTSTTLTLARRYGKVQGETKQNALDRALDARLQYLQAAKSNYELSQQVRDRIDRAEASVKKMRARMADQAKTASALEDMQRARSLEGGGSPSITAMSTLGPTVGSMVGMAALGPIGGVIGAVAGSATRPYTAISFLARMLNYTEKFQGKAGAGAAGLVERLRGGAKKLGAGAKRVGEEAKKAISAGERALERARQRSIKGPVVFGLQGMSRDDRSAKAMEVRDRVTMLAANPGALVEQMNEGMDVVRKIAPAVADSTSEVMQRAAMHLATKAPAIYEPKLTGGEPLIDDFEQDTFLRHVEAALDPSAALARLDDGSMSIEHVETLDAVYPETMTAIREQVQEALLEAQASRRPVSFEDRNRLGVLLGLPTDASLEPDMLAALQAVHGQIQAEDDAAEAQALEQSKIPVSAKLTMGGASKTAMEKIAGGDARQ